MSDFTIEQLEALKEGTTPGPWRPISSNTIWSRIDPDVLIPQYSRRLNVVIETTSGGDYAATKDVFLMAAAPALLDALIAEKRAHQELRAEIQRLQGSWSEWRPTRGDKFREGYQLATENLAARLARVLEATDE